MSRRNPVPEEILTALRPHGIESNSIVFTALADLGPSGQYQENWLGVTGDHLFVLEGRRSTPEVVRRARRSEPLRGEWSETGFERIALSDIEAVASESLASSGILTVTTLGQVRILAHYSNGAAREMHILAGMLKKLIDGKELTDSDFGDDRRRHCPQCGRMYPDEHRQVCPHCLDRRSLTLRILSFVPRYRVQISLILLLMLMGAALNLFVPYIGGRVVFDEVLTAGGQYEGRLLEVVLLMAAVQSLALGLNIMHARINASMTAQVICDLKAQVFTAMQRLSLSFFANKQTGGLMTRVNQDASHLQYFFHDGLPYFIVNSLQIVGIITTMLLMNWRLALLLLLPIPLIVYLMRTAFPKLWGLFSRRHRKNRAMNSVLNDTLTGVRVVKAFGREEAEIDRFGFRNQEVYGVTVDVGRFTSTLFPLLSFLMGLGALVIWGVGGWQVVRGEVTLGTLITFVGYIGMLYGPLDFMTHVVDWWTSCINAAQRIFEMIDAEPDVREVPNPRRLPHIRGDVRLENIRFAYEPNKPVLHEVSLDVRAGEMIGLVGHSGAGKSTLTNLISRLYDVTEGQILIDGIPIKELAIEDLRRQIGIVLQEPYLFTGSLAENIAYAQPDAGPEAIIRAAKIANAHDFIMKLPNGYETVIGHRGQNLSGGERQRISIARAILHNPRILILDEATASVDTQTERQIQEALERLVSGRTTFAIAHRLSTLRNADRLVVLEKGRVAEVGTHAELIKKKGVYFKLLQKQREATKIGVKIS